MVSYLVVTLRVVCVVLSPFVGCSIVNVIQPINPGFVGMYGGWACGD